MTRVTIQPVRAHEARRIRAPVLVAATIIALEAGLAALGVEWGPLSAAALVVAPGLALVGLLPDRARGSWPALLACVPALGIAVTSVALITVSSVGLALTADAVRATLAVLVVAGLFVPRSLPHEMERPDLLAAAGLALAVALGVVLQQRILGNPPVPGNDWAKYVLYADEIRKHGSLLIDNPYWMLGVPFREDPGVPSLYAAYLGLTGQPAQVVAQGIGYLAVVQVLSIFALVRSLWTPLAGFLAAALWATLPMDYTILGWHGVANIAALALLPLLLLYVVALLQGELDPRTAIGAGLVLVALAANHRLSLMVALGGLAVGAVGLVAAGRGRAVGKAAIALGAAALVVSPGVLYDLVTRDRSFGGTQSYRAYLSSKLDVFDVVGDLTIPFALVGVVATAMALRWLWRSRETPSPATGSALLVAMLAVTIVLGVGWIVHVPLHYTRMAYYFPLTLVPLVAVTVAGIGRPFLIAAVATVLVGYATVASFSQTDDIRNRYAFANRASISGLDRLAPVLRPREVVVTDRCWSFLSTWLLHTRVLPALESTDIQPKAEVRFAREARAVLDGTPAGLSLARRLGIRFAVVDPTCTDSRGNFTAPPKVGRPEFVSRRLAVLRLPTDRNSALAAR